MDCIQFEYKYEVGEIIAALETYRDEHPNADNIDTVKKMIDQLDIMSMCW